MKTGPNWKGYWEDKFSSASSNFEADRGISQRSETLESLSREELIEFVQPQVSDTIFDAGCGSGANIILLHDKVEKIVAIDFAASAVKRAWDRVSVHEISNVIVAQGDIANILVAKGSVDKILCMSVFHYLSDEQVRDCLRSFKSVLRPGGALILHVKNLSSVYIRTLVLAKHLRQRLSQSQVVLENYRSFQWYVKELRSAGFEIDEYNSFNLVMLEGMPRKLIELLQKQELAHRKRFPLNLAFFRRHGADLKIRAFIPY